MTAIAVGVLSVSSVFGCCLQPKLITAYRSSRVALMTLQTCTQSTPIATSARPARKHGGRGLFSETTAKALRMRRYAVSINVDPLLLQVGDVHFDKALSIREKAPRNGRHPAYSHALFELNAAILMYSTAPRHWRKPCQNLSALMRKKFENLRKIVDFYEYSTNGSDQGEGVGKSLGASLLNTVPPIVHVHPRN